jgi:hypothetical protein
MSALFTSRPYIILYRIFIPDIAAFTIPLYIPSLSEQMNPLFSRPSRESLATVNKISTVYFRYFQTCFGQNIFLLHASEDFNN